MSIIKTVRLTKLFLWTEAARFQTFPELVSKLEPEHLYSGMHEVARKALGSRDVDGRHLKGDDLTANLPGWELAQDHNFVLKGIGLLERRRRGYVLSTEGQLLANLYREGSKESAWKLELARILLSKEPRTRVILRLLMSDGALMRFGGPTWFAGSYKDIIIESEGKSYFPFPARKQPTSEIQDLLDQAGKWALGAWANEEPLRDADNVNFASVKGLNVYPYDLGTAMRGPFELFLHLGLLQEQNGVVTWQTQQASSFLPRDVLLDFGMDAIATESMADRVVRIIQNLAADDGFVVASDLRQALRIEGVEVPDKEIAELLQHGFLNLAAYDYGQARHGEGLFGDPQKQLVKFRLPKISR